MMKQNILNQLKKIVYILLPLLGGGWVGVSCSEEEAEATEWENWQQRNEAYFASLADSLNANPGQWQRILNYSLSAATVHDNDKYIYVKKIEEGDGTESPAFTDSVRVIYRGRLIPSASYPEGRVFDGTVYGQFSKATGYTSRQLVSNSIDGFATALQHMHRGDYWRVYIPSELGYGEDDQKSNGVVAIPGNSVIIFDVILVDFSPAGEVMPRWNSRQR